MTKLKHSSLLVLVVFINVSVRFLVKGGCDETPAGLQHRNKIQDWQLISSTNFDSNTPASNGRLDYTAGSSWCASSRDSTPYLQIDLGSVFIICGVATQGNSKADHWVKTYQVQYSINGTTWKEYRENGLVKTFQGNYDRSTVVKRFFFEAVEARYLRVYPKSHYNQVCIRLELYGVSKQVCSRSAVGVSDRNKVPDYRFSASSSFGSDNLPYVARLNTSSHGWAPERNKKANSWLEVDLGNAFIICTIVTQGSNVYEEWVKKYKVKLTMDGETWHYYRENSVVKVFNGNNDKTTEQKNELNQVATAKLFQEWPTEFHKFPTIRLEIYGVAQGCRSSLGIETRRFVSNSQLTSSSGTASDGRLYKNNAAWCSLTSSNTEYLQVDLNTSMTITGVATQGHPTRQQWVKTFTIKYSFDNLEWFDFKDGESSLLNSIDGHGKIKINWFKRPTVARYFRIYPQTWQQSACLRFDLYGCNTVNSPQVNVQGNAAVSGTGAFTKVDVTLECRARGQPSPDIKWTNGAKDVTKTAKLLTQRNGFTKSSTTFQVPLFKVFSQLKCQKQRQSSGVVRCLWRSYKCIASYSAAYEGARNSTDILLRMDLNVPAPVEILHVKEVKTRSVIISWHNPDPGHAQITSYKLQYWISSSGALTTNIKSTSNVNQYEVIGLTPLRDYNLTVIIKAVSIVGVGPQARMDQQFKTKQTVTSSQGSNQSVTTITFTIVAVGLSVLIALLAITTIYLLVSRMRIKREHKVATPPPSDKDTGEYLELGTGTIQQEQSEYQCLQLDGCTNEAISNDPYYENAPDVTRTVVLP